MGCQIRDYQGVTGLAKVQIDFRTQHKWITLINKETVGHEMLMMIRRCAEVNLDAEYSNRIDCRNL